MSRKEYEFKEFDLDEGKIVIPERGCIKGEIGGHIQLSIGHYGKPSETSVRTESSTVSAINDLPSKTSRHRPRISIRAETSGNSVQENSCIPKSHIQPAESEISKHDLEIIFRQFAGKKGSFNYEGKFLSLVGVSSVRKLYRKILLVICKYEDMSLEKVYS